ncbi:hypothetical protein [Comamonas thiooxydans]|nr:hypothetical protein [Comamonas thiooxydans]
MYSIELAACSSALEAMAEKCRKDLELRWPKVNFYADVWETNTHYRTRMLDIRFSTMISRFSERDPSYVLAFRCLMAKRLLSGKCKTHENQARAWKLLAQLATPLGALRHHDLIELESAVTKAANTVSARQVLGFLRILSTMLDELAFLDVIRSTAWIPCAESKAVLKRLDSQRENNSKLMERGERLDRQIEGLSDATNAMLRNDPRLTAVDRSTIAVVNILMCAPSRINEPLCLSIHDRYKLDDYAIRPNVDHSRNGYQTHQLLLMKGSKGAEWSPKPILNFMLDLSERCWNIVIELGQRSRRIVRYYEENPDRIYLIPEIEHLRCQPVSKAALWKIVNLTSQKPTDAHISSITGNLWNAISKKESPGESEIFFIENPNQYHSNGRKNGNHKIPVIPWDVAERYLLGRVKERMESMRWVSKTVRYSGRLSEMLVLIDTEKTPYLPQSCRDDFVRNRLKDPPWRLRQKVERSVFRKLGLKMTVAGSIVDCYIEPHDIRRWLTTKAMDARERLSDVLINKWANRVDINQLAAYDMRTANEKAYQTNLSLPYELEPLTSGLKNLQELEEQYGLNVDIVVAPSGQMTITSVDEVIRATENRPIARSSNQIIILYPNRFGVCLHQHHETPCRSYTGCAEGCNEQLTIKGHLPTNEEWRTQNDLNNRSIVNQLEALIVTRNREVADDQSTLDAHLLMLAQGVDVQSMAENLIERFHEIKDQIRDLSFRNELEAAFISRGVVSRLDDASIQPGALIKYHNPSKHASPGYERAIEARYGGLERLEEKQKEFHQKYPELGPAPLGPQDASHFLVQRDESGGHDDGQAA